MPDLPNESYKPAPNPTQHDFLLNIRSLLTADSNVELNCEARFSNTFVLAPLRQSNVRECS